MTASAAALSPAATKTEGRITRLRRQHLNKIVIAIAILAYAVVSHLMLADAGPVRFRMNPSPLLNSPLVLQAHVAGALVSFAIGCVLLLGVKGRGMHRGLGYAWIAAMAVTAITSFFLTSINPGGFSFIHALSAWTMIALPMGLAAARRRNIAAHRKYMTGLFMSGLLIAGLFSFLPGRLMWHLFFAA